MRVSEYSGPVEDRKIALRLLEKSGVEQRTLDIINAVLSENYTQFPDDDPHYLVHVHKLEDTPVPPEPSGESVSVEDEGKC